MLEIKTLANGIDLIMDPVNEVESVTLGIWVKTGAVNEDKKYAGISHFVEHMLFKGTETRTYLDIARDIDKIGGSINAFTGKEATCYHVKVMSSRLFDGAEVLCDMIENSVFPKKEMDKERFVIGEEIKMTLDSPEDLCHDLSTELIYNGNVLSKSIIGTPTSLKRITRNVMKDYVKKRYTKDNILVSIAGKFNEEEVISYFENRFLNLEEKSEDLEFENSEYRPKVKVVHKDVEQCNLCMGLPTFPMEDVRYYPMQVLNNILGGTMSSRLFRNIREERGLAYSVFSMVSGNKNLGYFKIYAGLNKDKVKDAIEGIREEIILLADNGISDDELIASKEQLKSGFVFSQESTASRMFNNGRMAFLMDRIVPIEEVISSYDKVTKYDVESLITLISDFSRYSAVAVTGNDELNLKKLF
ncbi:MAG: pitrilysin family protein [Clostridiales bacterium]|nr:pitrilysin family protein [Clostridiales bacterium]